VKDYEVNCGKYKRMKHRGVVCEKCGVEVIQSKCVVNVWATSIWHAGCAHLVLKSLPSRIGNLLDMTLKDLEKVLYFRVLRRRRSEGDRPGSREIVTEERYGKTGRGIHRGRLRRRHGRGSPFANCCAPSRSTNCPSSLRIGDEGSHVRAKRKKLSKRLKVVDASRVGQQADWMMLE